MINAAITHAQLFGIGFSFGMIGPCLLVCSPILITYIAGTRKTWHEALKDIFIFLSGRLIAYLALGYIAGLSGGLLRQFTGRQVSFVFRPAAGALSIIFAIIVLMQKTPVKCEDASEKHKSYDLGGLLLFGFIIGVSPCGPLLGLLSEIALMSRCGLDGMAYALSFGIGTLISGLIVVGAVSGLITWLPARYLKSNTGNLVFRILCAGLLILLGLGLIFAPVNPSAHPRPEGRGICSSLDRLGMSPELLSKGSGLS